MMKLSVAIADAVAGPSAFVVWRGFEDSARKAAEYGYHGVELALRCKEDVDAPALRHLLKQYGLEVSCVSTGQVFADLGLYLTNPDEAQRGEALRVLNGLVEMAAEFGGMINLGRCRGFIAPNQDKREATDLFLGSLDILLPIAKSLGVTVIIEPVNRYEINFINNVGECAALLKEVAHPNVGIMPDVFHMNIEDAHIGRALADNAALVKYVHLADSNRLAPGWGHLDFNEVFAGLRQGGYDGWVSIEILPKPDPDTAARQAADTILPLVRRYNEGDMFFA
ncbi:MAG: sugar phosphate isomerase/epimerase family protein [Candidatus Pelethousia sp.]|nr:sugar phosphate isomerase/epimerase family protein [Candidatus Pelethousia sp.]